METDFRQVSIDSKQYPKDISPLEKDKVLKCLFENQGNGTMKSKITHKDVLDFNCSKEQFEAIISQLCDLKLILCNGYNNTYTLTVNFIDFYSHGGFTMKEIYYQQKILLVKSNLKYLSQQVKQKDLLNKINQCIDIITSIIQVSPVFSNFF